MSTNKTTNTVINATADYEIEISNIVFHVHHEFGDTELEKLIADYLTETQIISKTEKLKAA